MNTEQLKKDIDRGFTDKDGVYYESVENWFFTGVLRGCGCGSSEEFGDRAIKVWEHFATDFEDRKLDIYENPVDELLAHWMDSLGIIEHGTGISGSWLSDKGKHLYKEYESYLSILEHKKE